MIDTSHVDLRKEHVLAELRKHVGRANGIHMRDLVARILNTMLTSEAAERKAREFVNELRKEGHPVCAHPASGYYIAENTKELDDCCKFLVERSQSTVDQVAAMKGVFVPDLYQQLGIAR